MENIEMLLNTLRKAYEVSVKIDSGVNANERIKKEANRIKNASTFSPIFILLTVFGGPIVAVVFLSLLHSIGIRFGDAKGFIVVVISMILIGLGIFLDIKRSSKKKEENQKKYAELKSKYDNNQIRINNLLEKNADVIDCVPEKYFYPIAIEYFIEVLSSGRADSLKEAMNLYEEQLHRWKIEDMTKMTMIAQQQTAANTGSIRRMTNVNTALNVLDHLK